MFFRHFLVGDRVLRAVFYGGVLYSALVHLSCRKTFPNYNCNESLGSCFERISCVTSVISLDF